MTANTLSGIAFALVATGVLFQIVTLTRVGARVARKWNRARPASRTLKVATTPAPVAQPRLTRRRARDYRQALRAAGRQPLQTATR